MRAAVGIARAGSDLGFAEHFDRAVVGKTQDSLTPGSNDAAQFANPRFDHDRVISNGRFSIPHGEIGHHHPRTKFLKSGERRSDSSHRFTSSGLEPSDIDRVIDVVVRIEFAETDLH